MDDRLEISPSRGEELVALSEEQALSLNFLERMARVDLEEALQAQAFLRDKGYELVANATNPEHNQRGYDETLNGQKTIIKSFRTHQPGDIAIAPAVSNPIPEAQDPQLRELIRLPQDVAIFRHESATRLNRIERIARFMRAAFAKHLR